MGTNWRFAIIAALGGASMAVSAATCRVDFSKDIGKLRPELHSSGFGAPVCSCPEWRLDDIRAMNFKAARTHDWALINAGQRVCDYFNIFPLVRLDATDPANYHFAPTDYLLKRNREELGLDILFRLGTSIEHSGPKVHFNAGIPEDFDKVAEIFAGTVRHYNRGWANGFNWNIRYWEIWNEPEDGGTMWRLPEGALATVDAGARDARRREMFVEFFVKCLKRLKAEFPDIKVGGPALLGVKWASEEWLRSILAGCRAAGVAPDFISWHAYRVEPREMIDDAALARRICDEYGFDKCELVLDEWHFLGEYTFDDFSSNSEISRRRVWEGDGSHNGIDSSCFNLSFLSLAQTSALSQAYYYGCRHEGLWGYMDAQKRKFKVFYGLKMFGEFVRNFDILCEASSDNDGVTVIAARNAQTPAVVGAIITDYRAGARELAVEVKGVPKHAPAYLWAHDKTRDFECVPARFIDGRVILPKADAGSAAFLLRF